MIQGLGTSLWKGWSAGCLYGKAYHSLLYYRLGGDPEIFVVLVLSLPGVVTPVFGQGLADSPGFLHLDILFQRDELLYSSSSAVFPTRTGFCKIRTIFICHLNSKLHTQKPECVIFVKCR